MKENMLKIMTDLYDWSLSKDGLLSEIVDRDFNDYVGWKIPAPLKCLDDKPSNRVFRSFSAGCMIRKMVVISSDSEILEAMSGYYKFYCILSKPNLWTSEVGIVFSSQKWSSMIYRDIETEFFREKTMIDTSTIYDDFGMFIPSYIESICFKHEVEDKIDKSLFLGGFHALCVN